MIRTVVIPLLIVANFYFQSSEGSISNLRRCADNKCEVLISVGRTTQAYSPEEAGVLSFKIDEEVKVYSKEAGTNPKLWGVEINGKRGYVPKKFIREEQTKVKKNDLKYYISTGFKEKPKEKVASQDSHPPEKSPGTGDTKTADTNQGGTVQDAIPSSETEFDPAGGNTGERVILPSSNTGADPVGDPIPIYSSTPVPVESVPNPLDVPDTIEVPTPPSVDVGSDPASVPSSFEVPTHMPTETGYAGSDTIGETITNDAKSLFNEVNADPVNSEYVNPVNPDTGTLTKDVPPTNEINSDPGSEAGRIDPSIILGPESLEMAAGEALMNTHPSSSTSSSSSTPENENKYVNPEGVEGRTTLPSSQETPSVLPEANSPHPDLVPGSEPKVLADGSHSPQTSSGSPVASSPQPLPGSDSREALGQGLPSPVTDSVSPVASFQPDPVPENKPREPMGQDYHQTNTGTEERNTTPEEMKDNEDEGNGNEGEENGSEDIPLSSPNDGEIPDGEVPATHPQETPVAPEGQKEILNQNLFPKEPIQGGGSPAGGVPVTQGGGSAGGVPVSQGGGSPAGGVPVSQGGGSPTGGVPASQGGGSPAGGVPVTQGSGSPTGGVPVTQGGGSPAGVNVSPQGGTHSIPDPSPTQGFDVFNGTTVARDYPGVDPNEPNPSYPNPGSVGLQGSKVLGGVTAQGGPTPAPLLQGKFKQFTQPPLLLKNSVKDPQLPPQSQPLPGGTGNPNPTWEVQEGTGNPNPTWEVQEGTGNPTPTWEVIQDVTPEGNFGVTETPEGTPLSGTSDGGSEIEFSTLKPESVLSGTPQEFIHSPVGGEYNQKPPVEEQQDQKPPVEEHYHKPLVEHDHNSPVVQEEQTQQPVEQINQIAEEQQINQVADEEGVATEEGFFSSFFASTLDALSGSEEVEPTTETPSDTSQPDGEGQAEVQEIPSSTPAGESETPTDPGSDPVIAQLPFVDMEGEGRLQEPEGEEEVPPPAFDASPAPLPGEENANSELPEGVTTTNEETAEEIPLTDQVMKASSYYLYWISDTLQLGDGLALALESGFSDAAISPGTFAFLLIVAFTIIVLYLSHMIVVKMSRESPLLEMMNKLDREQRILVEENVNLKQQLSNSNGQIKSAAFVDSAEIQEMQNAFEERQKHLEEELAASVERSAQLEADLEASTANEVELNKMLVEVLANQKDTSNFVDSVNQLQKQLDGQREIVESLTSDLALKTRLNDELRNELKASKTKTTKLEYQIEQLSHSMEEVNTTKQEYLKRLHEEQDSLSTLRQMNESLRQEVDRASGEAKDSRQQTATLLDENKRLKRALKNKEAECQISKECLKKLQVLSDSGGNDIHARLAELFNIIETKARLVTAEEELSTLQTDLQETQQRRDSLQETLQSLQKERDRSVDTMQLLKKEKDDALSKLGVLTQYYEEKETQLKKELESQEGLLQNAEGSAVMVSNKIHTYELELASCRSRIESLKKEFEEQKQFHKIQLTEEEKKLHDSWLATRAAERRQEELRQENTQLRQKLTQIQKDSEHQNMMMKQGKRVDTNGSVSSPLPLDGDLDPLDLEGHVPSLPPPPPPPMMPMFPGRPPLPPGILPPGLPPPPMHMFGHLPPPPMPDRRLPPAGRIASPPGMDRRSYSPHSDHSSYSDHPRYSPGPRRVSPSPHGRKDHSHYRRGPRRDRSPSPAFRRHSPERWYTQSPTHQQGYTKHHRSTPPQGANYTDNPVGGAHPKGGKKTSTPLGPNDR